MMSDHFSATVEGNQRTHDHRRIGLWTQNIKMYAELLNVELGQSIIVVVYIKGRIILVHIF